MNIINNKQLSILFCVLFTNFISAQNLEEYAENIMKRDSIPEMAFAIITKDDILVKQVLGHHKISEITVQKTAKNSDYFHLGSNTKAITSFIAAKLVESNKINWNTKFFDLFPEYKNKSNKSYYNITLEDLLSHRAKIQAFTSGTEYQNLPDFTGTTKQKRKKFAEYVLTLAPLKNEYNYSNAGYSVATIMLEKVSKKSWEQLINQYFKKDLNIDFLFGWPNRNYENQPYGHWIEDNKLISLPPETSYKLNLAEPAGDLSMSIDNYAKFIQLNIKGLAGENNFLKSETYKYLHTAKENYALGWGNFTKNSQLISEHAGSDGTFFSYALIDRKNLIAYIIFVNSGSETAQKGVFEMLELLKTKTLY